jgi:hypothetical protein
MKNAVMRLWYNSMGVGYHAYLPDGREVIVTSHFAEPDMSLDELVLGHTDWDAMPSLDGNDTDPHTWAELCAVLNYCRSVGITHVWDSEFAGWDLPKHPELRSRCVRGLDLWHGGHEELVPLEPYAKHLARSWRRAYPDLCMRTGMLGPKGP